MPRKLSNALTPLAVKNAKPGRHADGGGLHLLVKETGARSWVYRFMLKGKSRDVGLGAAGQGGISLADARTARDALRLKVKAGIDPLEERQRETTEALAAAQAAAIPGYHWLDVHRQGERGSLLLQSDSSMHPRRNRDRSRICRETREDA